MTKSNTFEKKEGMTKKKKMNQTLKICKTEHI